MPTLIEEAEEKLAKDLHEKKVEATAKTLSNIKEAESRHKQAMKNLEEQLKVISEATNVDAVDRYISF